MLDREAYAQRRDQKLALYRARGVPVLQWDTRAALPDLARPRG